MDRKFLLCAQILANSGKHKHLEWETLKMLYMKISIVVHIDLCHPKISDKYL